MSVTLKEVNEQNWKQCIDLEVKENQKNFIASNIYSIAQSKIFDNHFNLAVYWNDTVVGYILYCNVIDTNNEIPREYKQEDNSYTEIVRFMIDKDYQGRGIGTMALKELKNILFNRHGAKKLCMSYIKGNVASGKLFRKVGFQDIGKESNGEIILIFNQG